MALKQRVNFTCDICNMGFKTEYLYNKHKNKKNPCIDDYRTTINNKILELENYITNKDKCLEIVNEKTCTYCNTSYTRKTTLKNHVMTSCNIRKSYVDELKKYESEYKRLTNPSNNDDDNNMELDNEGNLKVNLTNFNKEDLIKILEQFQSKNINNQQQHTPSNNIMTNSTNNSHNNSNNTTNNVENQQNITNNIQITLNNYDQPNCEFLTIDQKNKFLKDRYKGLLDFITYVYFNDAYPENHTILYTNLRSKYGQIYKNNKWMIEEIDLIADKLNEYSFDKLSEHLDEIKNDDESAEKYKKDIDKGLAFVKHFTSNDTTKQSKTDIKKTLYNNKDLIEKTKKSVK
jgi:hypothetical protein